MKAHFNAYSWWYEVYSQFLPVLSQQANQQSLIPWTNHFLKMYTKPLFVSTYSSLSLLYHYV